MESFCIEFRSFNSKLFIYKLRFKSSPLKQVHFPSCCSANDSCLFFYKSRASLAANLNCTNIRKFENCTSCKFFTFVEKKFLFGETKNYSATTEFLNNFTSKQVATWFRICVFYVSRTHKIYHKKPSFFTCSIIMSVCLSVNLLFTIQRNSLSSMIKGNLPPTAILQIKKASED